MNHHTEKYIKMDRRIVEIIDDTVKILNIGNRGRSKAVSKALKWYVERLEQGEKYPDLNMIFDRKTEKCHHLTIENSALSNAENYIYMIIANIKKLRATSPTFKVKSIKEKMIYQVNLKNLVVKAVFHYYKNLVRGENETI